MALGLLILPLIVPAQSEGLLDATDTGIVPLLAPAAPLPAAWWQDWSRSSAVSGVDDAIVRLEAEGLAAATLPDGTLRYRVTPHPDGLLYDVFVRYAREPGTGDALLLQTLLGIDAARLRAFPLAEAIHVQRLPYSAIAVILTLGDVVAVELERRVDPMLDIAAAAALVVPHPQLGEGARQRWKVSGQGSVIAVLDTGIDKTHEAIHMEHYVGGYNATIPTGRLGDELLPHPGEPLPPLGTWTPLNEIDPEDTVGHGTHVAGIAFGQDPNGTYVGMAPDARFLDVQVMANLPVPLPLSLDELGGGPSYLPYGWGSFVIEGMQFVERYNRGESHLGAPGADRVDIVLLALGELEPDHAGDSVLSHAANRLVDSGVIVVAAAGNCGPQGACVETGEDTIPAPGAARQAITVGALNHHGTVDLQDESIAGSSSRGPNGGEEKPNLVAYGEPIVAPISHQAAGGAANQYATKNGTSMAAAQIAGIAALLLEIAPDLTPDEVKSILMATARDKGPGGWDPAYGAGAVNALFAVGVAFGVLDPVTTRIDERGQDVENQVPAKKDDKKDVVRVNRAPVAAFRHQPSVPSVGQNVVFIDLSSDPEGDRIVSFNWDFGDGNTAKGPRTAHSYMRPGEYRVVLSATDVHGAAGSATEKIMVVAAPDSKESPVGALGVLLVVLLAILAVGAAQRRRGGPRGGHADRANKK